MLCLKSRAFQLSQAIREIFNAFDADGNHRLDAKELRHAFASMVMATFARKLSL